MGCSHEVEKAGAFILETAMAMDALGKARMLCHLASATALSHYDECGPTAMPLAAAAVALPPLVPAAEQRYDGWMMLLGGSKEWCCGQRWLSRLAKHGVNHLAALLQPCCQERHADAERIQCPACT